jgi:hypothetical protein
MSEPERLRVTIDVDAGVHPLSGRLDGGGLVRAEFCGLIELISLLDRLADMAQTGGAGDCDL